MEELRVKKREIWIGERTQDTTVVSVHSGERLCGLVKGVAGQQDLASQQGTKAVVGKHQHHRGSDAHVLSLKIDVERGPVGWGRSNLLPPEVSTASV